MGFSGRHEIPLYSRASLALKHITFNWFFDGSDLDNAAISNYRRFLFRYPCPFLYGENCSAMSDCVKLCYTVLIRVPTHINTHKIIKIMTFINLGHLYIFDSHYFMKQNVNCFYFLNIFYELYTF